MELLFWDVVIFKKLFLIFFIDRDSPLLSKAPRGVGIWGFSVMNCPFYYCKTDVFHLSRQQRNISKN